MKKLLFLFAIATFFAAQSANARGVIIYSNGEKIEIVEKFPAEVVVEGDHLNLGVHYNQFSIFWVPMWNYGETKFVLVDDAKSNYYELDQESIDALKSEFGIEVPATPVIGFWNRIGGKIIWGVVLAALIALWWVTREKSGGEDVVSE